MGRGRGAQSGTEASPRGGGEREEEGEQRAQVPSEEDRARGEGWQTPRKAEGPGEAGAAGSKTKRHRVAQRLAPGWAPRGGRGSQSQPAGERGRKGRARRAGRREAGAPRSSF